MPVINHGYSNPRLTSASNHSSDSSSLALKESRWSEPPRDRSARPIIEPLDRSKPTEPNHFPSRDLENKMLSVSVAEKQRPVFFVSTQFHRRSQQSVMPLARGPRAYTRNYCYVYRRSLRRNGERKRERESSSGKRSGTRRPHIDSRETWNARFFLERKQATFARFYFNPTIISILFSKNSIFHSLFVYISRLTNEWKILLDFFLLEMEIFSRRGEGSVWREFSTDTRLPLQTVYASIRLPSLLLRVAPFPPMFLPFFSSSQPVSWLCIIYGSRQIPAERNRFFLRRERTASSSR